MELSNTTQILTWIENQYNAALEILQKRDSNLAAGESLGLLHIKNKIIENRDWIDQKAKEQVLQKQSPQIIEKLMDFQGWFSKEFEIIPMTIMTPTGESSASFVIHLINETNATTSVIADSKYHKIINYEELVDAHLSKRTGYIGEKAYDVEYRFKDEYDTQAKKYYKHINVYLREIKE